MIMDSDKTTFVMDDGHDMRMAYRRVEDGRDPEAPWGVYGFDLASKGRFRVGSYPDCETAKRVCRTMAESYERTCM